MLKDTKTTDPWKLVFSFKSLLIFAIIIAAIVLLIPKLITAEQAIKLIFKINKGYIAIAILCEIVSYLSAATLLGLILSRLGFKLRFIDRFRIGSIAAFTMHFFPVGTVGQNAMDYYFLRRKKVASGSILLMLILRGSFTYLAFLIIFLIGLILVPTAPHIPFSPKIAAFILMGIILAGATYLVILYYNKIKFHKFWMKLVKFANRCLVKLKKDKISEDMANTIFEDIYRGIKLITEQKRFFVFSMICGLIYWLGDIFCFFFVFLSFGYLIKLSVLIFGYGVGVTAGLLSFIPGGIGVTEGSLSLVYSGLGVPLSLVLMSILVFRFFSFWMWVPIGLHSYIKLTKEK